MKKSIIVTIIFCLILPYLSHAESSVLAPKNIKVLASGEEASISWQNPADSNFSTTIIFSSTIPIDDYFSFQAVEGLCDKLYEGREQSFVARDLAPNLPYYFIIFAKNIDNSYSDPVILQREADISEEVTLESNKDNSSGQEIGNTNSSPSSSSRGLNANGTLAGASATVVNTISFEEAEIVYSYNQKIDSPSNPDSSRLSLFIIVKSPHDLSDQDKNAISYFIDQGTPTTILLGAGERTGVLNSYLSVFEKLPRDELEWQDVIKIANGRWPNQKNTEAEEKASTETFSSIYQREADMDNPFDNAAVTVIAYGLRPAERNLESEKSAIKIYESIFDKSPVEAYEWDMVRAIAYSGAVR